MASPSTDYHGYGAVDFYGVEEHFGDLPTLQELVEAAHRHGSRSSRIRWRTIRGPTTAGRRTPPRRPGTTAPWRTTSTTIWQVRAIADPNAPADKVKATLEGWFINILPDLNQNDPRTAAYLIQNSLWWIDQTGLDAVRQDTLPYVPRTYWSRWTAALKREHPHLITLGELWDSDPKLVSFFQGGRPAFDGVDTGVDTLFDFPLCYAIRDVFAKHQPTTRLADTLAADKYYVNPRVLVTFLGLHDMPRFLNEPGADLTGLKLAFTFLLTTRGTPLIYYGDEIAMSGGGDPDNRRDFPGGFPGDPQNAFTARGRTPEQAEIHDCVRQLLQLRRQLEPLRRGDLTVVRATGDAWACVRHAGAHVALVIINNGTQPLTLELPAGSIGSDSGGELRERLRGKDRIAREGGLLRFSLPAQSSALYSD